MSNAIQELKRRGELGSELTHVDLELVLQDCSDWGDLPGVLSASAKLKIPPPKAIMENLLLTALCAGDYATAIAVCKRWERGLTQLEKTLLLENAIISGQVVGFLKHVQFDRPVLLAMFHTTIAIGVSRLIRLKRKESLPMAISLSSWQKTYKKELDLFDCKSHSVIKRYIPPVGSFFMLSRETLNRFLGILLAEGIITKDMTKRILALR